MWSKVSYKCDVQLRLQGVGFSAVSIPWRNVRGRKVKTQIYGLRWIEMDSHEFKWIIYLDGLKWNSMGKCGQKVKHIKWITIDEGFIPHTCHFFSPDNIFGNIFLHMKCTIFATKCVIFHMTKRFFKGTACSACDKCEVWLRRIQMNSDGLAELGWVSDLLVIIMLVWMDT